MAARPDAEIAGIFRREGEYWTIACEGRLIRLRDSKGLCYLSRLIRSPEERVHVDDLQRLASPSSEMTGSSAAKLGTDRQRVAVTKALRTALRKISDHDAALGLLLDRSIHTGVFCSYVPGSGCPPVWRE